MLAEDETRRLGAALAAAAELEGQEELADIRVRMQERRQAARGEGGSPRRSGRVGWRTGFFKLKKDGKKRNVYLENFVDINLIT